MSDIVTRLRMRPTIVRSDQFGSLETDRAATKLFDDVHALMREAADEIDRLRAEVAVLKAERDEALLRWQRLYGEIDCRVEHGADSNGHLEAIRKMMQKEAKP